MAELQGLVQVVSGTKICSSEPALQYLNSFRIRGILSLKLYIYATINYIMKVGQGIRADTSGGRKDRGIKSGEKKKRGLIGLRKSYGTKCPQDYGPGNHD